MFTTPAEISRDFTRRSIFSKRHSNDGDSVIVEGAVASPWKDPRGKMEVL